LRPDKLQRSSKVRTAGAHRNKSSKKALHFWLFAYNPLGS